MDITENVARALAFGWYLRKYKNKADAQSYSDDHYNIWIDNAKDAIDALKQAHITNNGEE